MKGHRLAALGVFLLALIWVLSGKFSVIGSAAPTAPVTAANPESKNSEDARRVVRVQSVHLQPHARTLKLTGQTQAARRVALLVRASGLIESLPFKQGSFVRKGELLLQLRAPEKFAALQSTRLTMEQRKGELEAAKKLAEQGNLSKVSLSLFNPTSLDASHSAFALAEQQEAAARMDWERTQVRAPFDGVLDRLGVEEGAALRNETEIGAFLELDPLLIVGEASERDLSALKLGSAASIELTDGRKLRGQLRYVSREASGVTRTYRLEVQAANPEHRVPAGMTAEIVLQSAARPAALLPRSVITLGEAGQTGVRVLDSGDTVRFVAVEILDDTPQGLVLSGVNEGARVIVSGQELVKDGEKVSAQP